jgi:predicted glutamine amidotransferase
MCRFLILKSKKLLKPEFFLQKFALKCRQSKALDGDWQGDGWGIGYKVNKEWKVYKSLRPIWREKEVFSSFPKTCLFTVHARSAFGDTKGVLEFNQPFIKDDCLFVFNGNIKGVRLRKVVKGKIGAQKIFNLFLYFLKNNSLKAALKKTEALLLQNSSFVYGLNIGVVFKDKVYALCQFQSKDENYFSLRFFNGSDFKIIASESILNSGFVKIKKGKVKII